jgi:hypothetical protein
VRKLAENIVLTNVGIPTLERSGPAPETRERVSTYLIRGLRASELIAEDDSMQAPARLTADNEKDLARNVLAGDTQAFEAFKELLSHRITT